MKFEIIHQGTSSRAGQSQAIDQDRTLVGRSRECDLSFDPEKDKEVSGKHGELLWMAGRLTYRDVGSTNGSFLNGTPVTGAVHVSTGDTLQFGRSGPKVRFTMVEGSLPPEVLGATIAADDLGQTVPSAFPKRPASRPALSDVPPIAAQQPVAPVVIQRGGGAAGWFVALIALAALGAGAFFAREELLAARATGEQQADQATFGAELLGGIDLAPLLSQGLDEEQLGEFNLLESRYQDIVQQAKEAAQDKSLGKEERDAKLLAFQEELNNTAESLAELQASARKTGDWSELANEFAESIFLVVVQHFDSKGKVVSTSTGTGFVVDANGILGTNAHVAHSIDGPKPKGAKSRAVVVIQNSTGLMFNVKRWVAHEDYDKSSVDSPDVALIWFDRDHKTEGTVTINALPLADSERVQALAVGQHLGTLGFPGELSGQYLRGIDLDSRTAPGTVATFKDGWITKLTDFKRQVGKTPARRYLIHHSASLSGGTSGSPMFNGDGQVIAVNNAGVDINLRDIGLRTPSASELGQGIRVDLLQELMDEHIN